jgi:hypothetical protein
MNIEFYLDQLLANKFTLPVAITVMALIIILIINWRRIRHQWLEWRTRRCLNQIGIKQIKNVVCSDGLDGNFKIDRLVMLHDSILLIAFKPYSGNIYCADSIPEWTQVVGQKSFKFSNPLFELENQVTAIQGIVQNVSVRGVLFFDHSAKFPKGHPDKVLNPDNIPEYMMRVKCPEPSNDILQCWQELLLQAKQVDQSVLLQK